MQHINKIFIKNIKWQFLGTVIQSILSAVFIFYLGKNLEVSNFGIYSILIAIVLTINLIVEPRMQDMASKLLSNFKNIKNASELEKKIFNELFLIETTVKILPLLLIFSIGELVINFININSYYINLLYILSICLYFSKIGYGLVLGVLRIQGRSDIITLCSVIEISSRLFLVIYLVSIDKLNIENSIYVFCLTSVLGAFLQWAFLIKIIGNIFTFFNTINLKNFILKNTKVKRLFFNSIGLSLTDLMNKDLDVILISFNISSDGVGLYKMAKTISLLVWKMIDPVYVSLMPELNRLFLINQYEDIKSIITKTTIGLFFLSLSIGFSSILIISNFSEILLGSSFNKIESLMMIMLVGVVCGAANVWGHPLSVAINRSDIAFAGSLISAIVGIILFIQLVPLYGITGASIAWSICFSVYFLYSSIVSYLNFRAYDFVG